MAKAKSAPTSLREHPRYKKEWDKLQELNTQRNGLERDIQRTLAHQGEMTARSRLESQAIALLDGQVTSDVEQRQASKKLTKLYDRRRVVEEAIRIQETRVGQARCDASAAIMEGFVPEYRRLLEQMACAVVELGKLADEEFEFRDRLKENGITFTGSIDVMSLDGLRLSSTDSEYSLANRWLRELNERYGINVNGRKA